MEKQHNPVKVCCALLVCTILLLFTSYLLSMVASKENWNPLLIALGILGIVGMCARLYKFLVSD